MMVTILRCWWHKKYVGNIFLHVGDIPIGHQHHNVTKFSNDIPSPNKILEITNRSWVTPSTYSKLPNGNFNWNQKDN